MSLLEGKRYELLLGNCLDKLKEIPDNFVDSIVTDPPYELGFMNKSWDSTGIAYNVELWKECLRVLKPGGHLLSFGGSRTYHRMACAIEDAGFEIRDQIMWVYGSGFPKSHNVGKAIDKKLGNEREVIGYRNHLSSSGSHEGYKRPIDEERIKNGVDVTKGTSEYEGWGSALKPAHEPIVMARKPFKGTIVDNVLEWGVGAINIDGCRVGDDEIKTCEKGTFAGGEPDRGSDTSTYETHTGRWPANFIHDGSEEVVDLFPNNSNRFFYVPKTSNKDRNEGCEDLEIKPSGSMNASDPLSKSTSINGHKKYDKNNHPTVKPLDLMRQLVNLKNEELEITEEELKSIFYCAKTNKKDRNEGCEDLEEKWLSGYCYYEQGNLGNGMFKDRNTLKKNNHPTVKPTDLMCYLERLITPKDKIVLDPFMGSGSTGKAAMYEGFKFIGIEMNEEYIEIAKRRIEFALKDVKKDEKEEGQEEDSVV